MEYLRRWIKPGSFDAFGVRYQEPRPVPRRLRCAWAVLRGRPVAYRIHVTSPIEFAPGTAGACVVECKIDLTKARA